MLRKVKLYGELGDKFGKEFMLNVDTPHQAVRLLSANFKDFAPYLAKNSAPGYHVIVGANSVGEKELLDPAFGDQEIKIVPVVQGAGGDDGIFQVVLGAALIYFSGGIGAALGAGQAGALASGAALEGFGLAAGSFASNLGWSLIFGGVSQMLFSPPETAKQQTNERPENKPSYLFDGPINTVRQGNAVPVGYGRLLVGSQVISAGLFAEAISV